MFPSFDQKFFEQIAANPAGFLSKLSDFQRANFEAARQIAENNIKTFQELAAVRDPQAYVTTSPAILKAAVEQNVAILTHLWESLGVDLAPPAPRKK
jgi:hypothetical protein